MDLPRYCVSLTSVGRIAFRLGLHHRFVDRLPESVTAQFRESRKTWWDRKLQTATEA